MVTVPTLRPYQDDFVGINGFRGSFMAGYKAPLGVLPTGGGKTIAFCYMAASAVAKGGRVLILVHRIELMRQTSTALSKFGIRHGLINPKFTPDLSAPVQVASVQTLVKRLSYAQQFKPTLVVIDEAHHANAGTWSKILDVFNCKRLGVTATPIRTDGTGLEDSFDDLILGPTTQQLIDMKYLVPTKLFCPKPKFTGLDKVGKTGGDYNKKQLAEVVGKPSVTGDAVEKYLDYSKGLPGVTFCYSREHAHEVAEQFRKAGVNARSVDGMTDDDERFAILNGLGNGNTEMVCSCDIISEGTDIPAVSSLFLLRPTMSLSLFIQQVGRGLRLCEELGKTECLVFDHVGNSFKWLESGEVVRNFGYPEDDREWSLKGVEKGTRQKSEQKVTSDKQCTSCYAVFKPAPKCPDCGAEVQVQSRDIEHTEGELVELKKEEAIRAKEQEKWERKNEVWEAKTLQDLINIERKYGYNKGWAESVLTARKMKQAKRNTK